jgi:broad specificity phosphatase PhoE
LVSQNLNNALIAILATFLQEVAASWPQSAPSDLAVAVTHGGLITDFLALAFSADVLNHWPPAFLARQSQLVAECSITIIDVTRAGRSLEGFADTAHLLSLDDPHCQA